MKLNYIKWKGCLRFYYFNLNCKLNFACNYILSNGAFILLIFSCWGIKNQSEIFNFFFSNLLFCSDIFSTTKRACTTTTHVQKCPNVCKRSGIWDLSIFNYKAKCISLWKCNFRRQHLKMIFTRYNNVWNTLTSTT